MTPQSPGEFLLLVPACSHDAERDPISDTRTDTNKAGVPAPMSFVKRV
jgi:hypothetical protein